MKPRKLVLLPLLITGALTISWYFYTNPTFVAQAAGGGSTMSLLKLTGLTTLVQTQGQTKTPSRKVFFNTGDGRFISTYVFGQTGDTTVQYGYRSTGSYQPYSESTEIYTDKKPPKNVARLGPDPGIDPNLLPDAEIINQKVMGLPPVSPTALSSNDPFKITIPNSKPIGIEPTRRLVPESGVTYIVTFENLAATNCGALDGNVKLAYDADIMDFIEVKDYYTQNTYQAVITTQQNGEHVGEVTVGFSSLQRAEQRSLFFLLKLKDEITIDAPIDQKPKATLTFTNNTPGCSLPGGDNMVVEVADHGRLHDSHDPNHKVIFPAHFCPNVTGNFTFRIDFQNDGAGPTETIVIEDELDYLFPANVAITNNPPWITAVIGGKLFPFTQIGLVPLGNRQFKFTLNHAVLRGIYEPGYGTAFGDTETRGYLEFEIPASTLTARPVCNALCNRARIIFDCNPPIETETALSRINCSNCGVCQDSVEFGNIDTALQMLPVDLLTKFSNGYYCKWYPASGVSNPTDPGATVTATRTTMFTFVASAGPGYVDSCRRFVYHRLFEVPCNLHLVATVTPNSTTGCPASWTYDIQGTASGTGFQASDLVWADLEPRQGCPGGQGPIFTKHDVPPGLYRVAVTDPGSGCYAEEWLDLRYNPIVIDDNPTDCKAALLVQGGTGPYSYQWAWNGQPQSHTGASLNDLNGKSQVKVTVTDSKGCTAVFAVLPAQCGIVVNNNYYTLVFMGLLVGGIALLLYLILFRHKNRR